MSDDFRYLKMLTPKPLSGPSVQELEPVQIHPCDRCGRTHGHDGYPLPTTEVTSTIGEAYLVLCKQCLKDAIANLETEQARHAPPK